MDKKVLCIYGDAVSEQKGPIPFVSRFEHTITKDLIRTLRKLEKKGGDGKPVYDLLVIANSNIPYAEGYPKNPGNALVAMKRARELGIYTLYLTNGEDPITKEKLRGLADRVDDFHELWDKGEKSETKLIEEYL